MPRASEIKKGFAINVDGKTVLVKDIEVTTPGGRGGQKIYRFRGHDVATGVKTEVRHKADEIVETIDVTKRAVMFSYVDGNEYIFMDNEDYTQFIFNGEMIEDELLFINEETQGVYAILIDGTAATLELPSSVELIIEETDPSIKGASASARTKPARLSTGLTVQVPEYIATGDKVVVNTAERKYMNRAS
ncbi:elongation factor P-like protein YeiP [Vibrio splendidus]|jgi:elongation factor P|uniref:Elongation factor P-like protein n=1 Tax=Vibrio splendidus TaxID=29497 RepID=A0A2N7FD64_VIBSP|nr:elongation factor P-like protein YeiP [Vibrio splendidus]PMG34753.1 elongation factor P-like protein YeiP [Vibrio splendidus]PMH11429.1 elongation factor P-like protein YeiP [Vibrio splendidus]PMI74378.1 elongation factor P-like protein YeiP [Vibrio splendidus]PMJ67236.1 elongation factor P-like protein YeiP [Vibrio splendidus]PMK02867.1 elongation factor P-like protein YeiP [Vibrio splendidus]